MRAGSRLKGFLFNAVVVAVCAVIGMNLFRVGAFVYKQWIVGPERTNDPRAFPGNESKLALEEVAEHFGIKLPNVVSDIGYCHVGRWLDEYAIIVFHVKMDQLDGYLSKIGVNDQSLLDGSGDPEKVFARVDCQRPKPAWSNIYH